MQEEEALATDETWSPVGTVATFYGMVAAALLITSILGIVWRGSGALSWLFLLPAIVAVTLRRGSKVASWLVRFVGWLALVVLLLAALTALLFGLEPVTLNFGDWEQTHPTLLEFSAFWLGTLVVFCLPAWLLTGPRARLDLDRRSGRGSESVIWAG